MMTPTDDSIYENGMYSRQVLSDGSEELQQLVHVRGVSLANFSLNGFRKTVVRLAIGVLRYPRHSLMATAKLVTEPMFADYQELDHTMFEGYPSARLLHRISPSI